MSDDEHQISVSVPKGRSKHDEVLGRKKDSARKIQLGDLATNRILYALALLGVLLPVSSIVSRYPKVDFTYSASHDFFLKGPYHVQLILFFHLAEILLAAAVYVYGFGFIFDSSVFDRIGTFFYAAALLTPPSYLAIGFIAEATTFINRFSTPILYPLSVLLNLTLFVVQTTGITAIFGRLDNKSAANSRED